MPKPSFDTERFAEVLPHQQPEAVKELREMLEQDGCLDTLKLAEINGTKKQFLCDGFTRYGICSELGIPYKTAVKKFDSEADVIHWMYSYQAGRRNWTTHEQAQVAAKWRASQEEKPTIREAAEKFNANISDVHAATVVQESGSAALQEAVKSGEVPIRQAKEIARLPKREQSVAIREGIDAVKSEDESDDKDETGKSVPKELREAFKSRAIFDQLLNDIRTIKTTLNPLIGNPQTNEEPLPGFEHLSRERQELIRVLDQAREFIKFARPYAVCRKHEGKRCQICGGTGFLTKAMFERKGK